MIGAIFRLRRLIKECDLVYVVGLDLAFFSYLSSIGLGKPHILDVADIREIQVSRSVGGFIVRQFDRYMAARVDLIVATSKAFIDWYYKKFLNVRVRKSYLLENKVDYDIPVNLRGESSEHVPAKLRIGYLGVLRDNWTVELLREIVKKYPERFEAQVAGINMISRHDLNDLHQNCEGFTYTGPYHSPEDLPDLYRNIDVIAIFYPEHDAGKDWFEAKRICRSNRFYEACYFRKPMIAYSFSEDGRVIKKMDIGLTIDTTDTTKAIETIVNSLTKEKIGNWRENINKLPSEIYKFKNEARELKSCIDEIFNRSLK